MSLLPIVQQELRAATRKPGTYWSRVAAGLVAAAITVWMLGTLGTLVAPDLLGARMFKALANLAFFCCLFPGVVLTADSLSSEKRAGTLGLLFLTDLKGFDIVLGKLTVSSLRAFYGLLAMFPLLAISFLVGGVTAGEFWRTIGVLANTLFLSLAAGMFISAVSWQAHYAMLGTVAVVLGLAYVMALPGAGFAVFSPATGFSLGFEVGFRMRPRLFFASLAAVHSLGWLFLALASYWAPQSWQQRVPIERRWRTAQEPRRERGLPGAPCQRVPETRPAEWLARRGQKIGWIWASLTLVVAVWLVVHWCNGRRGWSPLAAVSVAMALHAMLHFWVAWEAGRRLHEARQTKLLEQILTTPLAAAEVVRGHLIAMRRQFGWLVLAVTGFDLALLAAAHKLFTWRDDDWVGFLILFIGMIWLLGLNAYALARLGLWRGLICPTLAQACLSSLGSVVLLPSGIFLIAMLAALRTSGPSAIDSLAPSIAVWIVLSSINAYAFCAHAQDKLDSEFRSRAAALPLQGSSWTTLKRAIFSPGFIIPPPQGADDEQNENLR